MHLYCLLSHQRDCKIRQMKENVNTLTVGLCLPVNMLILVSYLNILYKLENATKINVQYPNISLYFSV